MTGGFKLKFSFRLPSFFRRRRHRGSSQPVKSDAVRSESKLDNSGGDNFLDYYRTYWSSSNTLAAGPEDLPGISDTAKILRFLLSGEEQQDGAGGGLLFCDDIIRSAKDYEEDVTGFEISTDKRKSRRKQHQKGSADSKRGQQRRATEDRTVPAGGQLARSDLARGQGPRMQEDWTATAGGQLKRPDLNGGQWTRLQEGWSAAVGGQASERERSYSCEQRRDLTQNRFLSEESRAWYSTPSKLELRASEWL
jgi:hypothetical protein